MAKQKQMQQDIDLDMDIDIVMDADFEGDFAVSEEAEPQGDSEFDLDEIESEDKPPVQALSPEAAMEYVTVYGPPTVDEDGRMAPVPELMLNAAGAVKVPPVVPAKLTLCPLETEEQNAVPA